MTFMTSIIKYFGISLFPIFILSSHWLAVKFYSNYCVSNDFVGYLLSYITVSSPICSFCLTLLEKTGTIYLTLWTSFSLVIIQWLSMISIDIMTNNY